MSIPLITRLVLLFTVCLLSADVVDAAKHQPVTEDPFVTRSLSTSTVSFRQILIDAFRQLIAAPMKIMKALIQEVSQFFKGRDFRKLYDMNVIKQILGKAPKRLYAYYEVFMSLENDCVKRTACDVSEYTSRRVPKWMSQMAFIYFNTFVQSKHYYEAIVHGLTVKNCSILYAECDPEQFVDRLHNNITTSIATTVAPLSAALNDINDALDNDSHSERPMNQAQRLEADLMKQLEEVKQEKAELIHQQQMLAQQQQMIAQQQRPRPRPQESDEDFEDNRRRFPTPQASRRH